jgi:asparagine synthase (glutamine-hydrolysing)
VCGIAGCYQQVDGQALARTMIERQIHRGPDDEGFFSFDRPGLSVQLAHRRLSIIDLSPGGRQPLTINGLTLCYNGELYNYKTLKAELSARGVRFTTSSDNEVVLEAWRQWGPACLKRFRGMFAFALFDERSGSLTLVRDQLGIKPLHYLQRDGGVLFASELKAIVSAIGRELATDPTALVASMLYYWVPPNRCAIAGVKKLSPGSWVEFKPDGTSKTTVYWDISEVASAASAGSPHDLRAVIEASVEAHMVADVPVSSFLSGGLDSSIVTVLAKRLEADLDAYTITFRPEDNRFEAMPDDAVYARKVAKLYGIQLHEIESSPDVANLLPRMVDILDEPIGDPAAINTLLMCQAAREAGVKVVLSGMGADELFGGYRKHLACLLAARYRRLPGAVRRPTRLAVGSMPAVIGGRGLRHARWAKRFMTFAELPEAAAFRRSYTLYSPPDLEALLSPELRPYVGELLAEHDAIFNDTNLEDLVDRMCLADTRLFLPGLNLAYTDRASMAASVEVRVPFVDPAVVAAAFSLVGSAKIHGRTTKAALKEVSRGWLPDEIVHRPKASFGVPLRAWISRDLSELVDDVLVSGELVASGFLEREPLKRLVEEERSGREDRSKQIWQLLTLELWCKHVKAAGVAA